MKLLAIAALAVFAASCTPGGIGATASGPAPQNAQTTTIDVNLTLHADGYSPDSITLPVGSSVRFANSDGFAHTATVIPGATSFPAGSPFTASALTQRGSSISQAWSTGSLPAGAASQTILLDAAGMYYFGCFYHYGAPMRGTIVVH